MPEELSATKARAALRLSARISAELLWVFAAVALALWGLGRM
ncbi:hypothetical protein ACIBCP_32515 [Streptomyces sp. NPDC051287]